MVENLRALYRQSLWQVYARAIAIVSILGLLMAGIIGGYDLLELSFPAWTLNSALHEKYQSNESFTKFGAFHKGLSDAELTRQRQENYEGLLRTERRNATQSLAKVGLGLLVMGVLNLILKWTYRPVSN